MFVAIVDVAQVAGIQVEFFAFRVATYSRYVSVYLTYHSGLVILTYAQHDHHINYADLIEYRKIAGHSTM